MLDLNFAPSRLLVLITSNLIVLLVALPTRAQTSTANSDLITVSQEQDNTSTDVNQPEAPGESVADSASSIQETNNTSLLPATGHDSEQIAPEEAPTPPSQAQEIPPQAVASPSTPSDAPPDKEQGPTITGKPGEGVTLRVNDAFSINLRSRFQLRYQFNVSSPNELGERDTQQLVNIGTARLWISGNILNPDLTYMLQLAFAGRDFRDGATSPIYDAYLQWAGHRDFNLRAGQYFVPFDRLRTVREWALQMADRPRPVQEFTLDRDAGLTIYSEKFLGDHSPLAWYLGAFGGGGTNLSVGRDPGALLTSRVELRPLGKIDDDREGDLERASNPRLAVGGAFAANFNTNRLRSTTGPTFSGGTTDYLHAAADLTFKWYGWALQAEYLWKHASADQIVSTASDGTELTEYTRSGYGWVVQTSYIFPHPIEVVGRLSGLYAFSGTDPRLIAEADALGQEVAAGLNYYINGHKLKLQSDWIARMPHDFAFKQAEHVVHAQVDVTF